MKIAIISDSHDNLPNIDKMLEYVKQEKVEVMLHCGDVCAPGVMKYLAENFEGEIFLVYGNVDGDRERMEELAQGLKNLRLLGDQGSPKIKGLKSLRIGMVHRPSQAREMAKSGQYDLIFYGDNHKAWEEKVGDCQLINPGTLAGLFAMATFAVYDTMTRKADLKIVYQL